MGEGSELHSTILVYCTAQGGIFLNNGNQTIFSRVCFWVCTLGLSFIQPIHLKMLNHFGTKWRHMNRSVVTLFGNIFVGKIEPKQTILGLKNEKKITLWCSSHGGKT